MDEIDFLEKVDRTKLLTIPMFAKTDFIGVVYVYHEIVKSLEEVEDNEAMILNYMKTLKISDILSKMHLYLSGDEKPIKITEEFFIKHKDMIKKLYIDFLILEANEESNNDKIRDFLRKYTEI